MISNCIEKRMIKSFYFFFTFICLLKVKKLFLPFKKRGLIVTFFEIFTPFQ